MGIVLSAVWCRKVRCRQRVVVAVVSLLWTVESKALLARARLESHTPLTHTHRTQDTLTHTRTLLLLLRVHAHTANLHGAENANFRIGKLKHTWKYQLNRIDSSELKLLAMKMNEMKQKWCDYTIVGTRKGPQKQRQRQRRLSQYRRMFSKATVFFCICFPQEHPHCKQLTNWTELNL